MVDAGMAAGDGSNVGSVLYTRGMYAAMLAAEAVRKAAENGLTLRPGTPPGGEGGQR